LLREHAEVGEEEKAQNGMASGGNHAEYEANELPVGENNGGRVDFQIGACQDNVKVG